MEHKEQWTLKIWLKQEGEIKKQETEFLSVTEAERKVVHAQKKEGKISFFLRTDAREDSLVLETDDNGTVKELELIWLGHRVELWTDGKLMDEEWPEGRCIEVGKEEIQYSELVEKIQFNSSAECREPIWKTITEAQFWAPELGRHNVGDCMPFADGDTYHLFYLKDRHQHKSKWGMGAHQFAHISSKDLKTWQEHPVAVEITHQWEGSICTGSVIKVKDKYYVFYAVRMMDGSSAKVSWATSEDCIHFTKSERYFTLTAPYETTSVRDPEVFFGADGKYHMLLTTNWESEKVEERSGCLAHMISDDIENWEQKEPFLIPGYTDQPECSDYFEWNGWYYLIFSNYGTAKYRYSRYPFGPWNCPENEIIDGLLYRVPKTADFGGRRIAAGFLCINTAGESYAGNVVFRELKQNPDGTLDTCFVKEMLPENIGQGQPETVVLECGSSGGYECEFLPVAGEYFAVQMRQEKRCDSFGLTMRLPNGSQYEIRVQPTLKTVGVLPAHSNLYYYPTKRFLTNVKGLDQVCTLEVVLKKGILDLCINGERTLVCRLESEWSTALSVNWGCYVKDGKVEFEVRN